MDGPTVKTQNIFCFMPVLTATNEELLLQMQPIFP